MMIAEVNKILMKLNVRELILLFLAYNYPVELKREEIERFVHYYKPSTSKSAISNKLTELKEKGLIKRVRRGYYVITVHGLRRVRWYWLTGRIPLPRERLPLAVDRVRCKVRRKKDDGSYEIIYL